jgi:small subunit ribosomal protein S2
MQETKNTIADLLKDLFNVGAHFGYTRKRRHPSVEAHILGYKNNTAVINLESTATSLNAAADFLKNLGSQNKVVLWVGNKPEARSAVERAAALTEMPYVSERWIGGTMTNFTEIKKRIKRLLDLSEEEKKGGLLKYTKKERLVIGKEKSDLERHFRSIANLEKLPAAIVVVDSEAEKMAVDEAIITKVPVVGIASSDCDVNKLNYPVYGNDGNIKSIGFLIDYLAEAYMEGKKQGVALAEAQLKAQLEKDASTPVTA